MKIRNCKLVLIAIFLGLSFQAFSGDIELRGLLVNKTITWFGQDFFHKFSSEWRNQRIRGQHGLVIEEIPSIRKGTQIVITYKGEVVFRTTISATRSQSREQGSQALQYVLSRVQDIDNTLVNRFYADLGEDEI